MARKAFYTDKLGRRWKWDAALKKYQYIRKDAKQQTTVAIAPPSNVRNLEIYNAYRSGEKIEDVATKHGLSVARLRQIIYQQKRIKKTATVTTIPADVITKKKATGKVDKKIELFEAANDRAKRLCEMTGVLALGAGAEDYIEKNLQSIFAKTKTQVNYLRGVSVEQPLGKPGSWLQDEKFVDQIITEMQKIVDDLTDRSSAYYKQVNDALDETSIDSFKEKALKWVDKLEEMKIDKKILFTELEEAESITGDAVSAIHYMPSSVLAQIIPYEDWQTLESLSVSMLGDKELTWTNLPPSIRVMLINFGINDELYNRKKWGMIGIQSLITAAFYSEGEEY